jgi:hypothetical protein
MGDISVIETIMTHPKPTSGLSQSEKEELAALREIIKSKANKTELAKIRKKLDEGGYLLFFVFCFCFCFLFFLFFVF